MASSSSSSIAAAQPENGSRGAFDGIAISPSISSSKPSSKPSYQVFINHRGPDVKQTLASVLYGIFTAMSLSVFLDSEELEYGDPLPQTIQAAMATALVHIAIFSKRYAESPWCLAELTFMLKSGAKIIPIFYHVDPSDLRWVDQGRGKYVESFEKHEQKGRYSPKQLQEWKTALHNVSLCHGQIVKSDEDEKRLLKNIVSYVMKEINDCVPLEIAKHPVGIKDIVKDFMVNTIGSNHSDGDVQIVGIWGMGGSGKTTLAKALYKELGFSMQRSSIVFNVRDAATKGLLHEKQKTLLNDLGIHGLTFDNIEDGKRNLSRGMRSIRALIVLDDVDNIKQLDALLPTKDSLQKGSFVIVTTRRYDVLQCSGISSIYQMRPLNPSYAMQLFCWHAFLKSSPPNEFKELVKQFLAVCKGLPLSLKVLGAQLYGQSRKEYWESQLDKVMRILPEDIEEILKTSYDTLDDEEKEMFLDSASLFLGAESSLAIEVWNGMGWSGLQGWERLFNRCLVELDNDNHIKMHDHLRDLGKTIRGKQMPYGFWSPQQINDIHEKSMGMRRIVTISKHISHYQDMGREQLPEMTYGEIDNFRVYCSQGKLMVDANGRIWSPAASLVGLKYLVISKDFFNEVSREQGCLHWFRRTFSEVIGEVSREQGCLHWFTRFFSQPLDELPREVVLGEISRELVWLRWFEIPHRNLPVGLSLQKLRILELFEADDYNSESDHHLEELWGENEVPLQLRQLLISYCTKLQCLPKSIGCLSRLKKIVIVHCYNLRSLPEEFGHLKSLEHLLLAQCRNLSSLPGNFGNLSNLQHLSLVYCHQLKRLPISFKNLTLLKHLNLGGCFALTFTSEELHCLENIKGLEFLNFDDCRQVEELPHHLTNQVSLRELYLECGRLRELPDNIGQLRRLKVMKISHALFTSLPSSFGNLSSLNELAIYDCYRVERLPDSLGDLSSLRRLSISKCSSLERLPDSLGDLSSLRRLSISKCSSLERLPDSLGNLSSLRTLFISLCSSLERLPDSLGDLSSLTELSISGSGRLERLPDSLGNLSSLRGLYITECSRLEHLPDSLGDLSSLTYLEIDKCSKLNAVPKSIRQLNNLQGLNISYCPISELNFGVESLYFCLENINLESTDLCRISLSEESYPRLESLLVSKNNHLEEIEELPRSLKRISLRDCEMLKSIPSFAEFTSLTNFSLKGDCYGIQKIEGLENCTRLQSLTVDSCWEVPGIESLECMQNLKWLELKANKRSVIERCIQRMQISPEEIRICARAVPDAASLLHSLLTPNLFIIEDSFFSQEKLKEDSRKLKINSNGTDDSYIYCFLLNCVSAKITFNKGYVEVGKGRWALAGVVREVRFPSIWFEAEFGEEGGIVEVGLVGRGKEQTAVETIRSLLPLLET